MSGGFHGTSDLESVIFKIVMIKWSVISENGRNTFSR